MKTAEPSRKNIYKMFNTISSTYDKANRIISLGTDQRARKALIKQLPNHNQIHLLDLATGTLDQLICLMESTDCIVKAVGIDLAENMLQIGRKKIENKPYRHKVQLLKADATSIPFEKESFECVTISFGIRNVESLDTCLQEIFRVLKKGGRCLILEMSMPKNPFWKSLHLFYLRHVLPNLGGLISNNKKAYRYLNQTTETFPSGNDFCKLLIDHGFQNVKAHPLTFGAITLYQADKPLQ